MRRLGCLTPFGMGAGLIALAGVALAALLTGGAMFSPGPLSAQTRPGVTLGGVASHAELGGACASCHASPLAAGGMTARCLDCHTDIAAEQKDATTLHGAIPAGRTCQSCHGEHKGASTSLSDTAIADLDHTALGFALTAHQTTSAGQPFACADCHTALAQEPRLAGAYRFTAGDCLSCHQDYQRELIDRHVADVGQDCLACHDGVDRYSGFDHSTLKLPLDGKHAEVSCLSCHKGAGTPAGFKGLESTCLACHQADDVHKGALGADCASCHTAAGWQQTTFNHDGTAFPLTGAHLNATCASCHGSHLYKGTPTSCVSCHAEPQEHLGQFGTDCNSCHSTDTWERATFDHNRTAFPLNGAHVNVACASCHANNVYKGTPTSCVSCHAEPQQHLGQFGTNCNSCHSTSRWEGAVFKHSFPLNHGGGGTIACATCHTLPNNYRAYTCLGCHAHSEANVLAEHRGRSLAELSNCVRCHAGGHD